MKNSEMTSGVVSARLTDEQYQRNFSDVHLPLTAHEASIEADRCYFCYEAPCISACPTEIDIPLFIRQIATGTAEAAAKTIFESNILGGICARVCPTETLCEEACVREEAEGQPVEIGRLQRYATDTLMNIDEHPFERSADTGRSIAVIGAGPAGIACAHRLAMKGNRVKIFECLPKGGGLNEYGIAAYKTVDSFAARELQWIMGIGGIEIETGCEPIDSEQLDHLRQSFDAVFLAVGLRGVNALDIGGDDIENVGNAVDFIAGLRQAEALSEIPVGRQVVVIGGGMTAIDAAVQSRLLGAQDVTIAYRRSQSEMSASKHEQDWATSKGVRLLTQVRPVRIIGRDKVQEVELEYTETDAQGHIVGTGENFRIGADLVLRAIGQKIVQISDVLTTKDGKISVKGSGRTNLAGVWAGGDCAAGGQDLTVTAVAEGRDAAEDIHQVLNN